MTSLIVVLSAERVRPIGRADGSGPTGPVIGMERVAAHREASSDRSFACGLDGPTGHRAAAQIGGYLKLSLSTPLLTRASAAVTCRRTAFTKSPLNSKSGSDKGIGTESAAETVFR